MSFGGLFFRVLLALLLVYPPLARATLVTFSVCVVQEVDYEDEDMGDKLTDSTYPAIGVSLRYTSSSGANTDIWTSWSGPSKGCNSSAQLDDAGAPYTVKVVRKALVNGNTLEVRDEPDGSLYATTVSSNFTPAASGQYSYSLGSDRRTHILMAASFAMSQSNGGTTGETYTLYDQGCPPQPTGSCAREDGIYIADNHADEKRVIAHELGHAVDVAATGGQGHIMDYEAVVDDCTPAYTDDGHSMNSKEYASAAFVEGFAHFYSAVAFNDLQTNADCELWKSGVDWDLDADDLEGPPEDPEHFSCSEGFTAGPALAPILIPDEDLLGAFCIGTGESENRATEYDFLRAMWVLATVEGVPVETLFDLWAEANPHSWEVNGEGTGGDYPSARMHDAAFSVGGSALQADYDAVASDHGISR